MAQKFTLFAIVQRGRLAFEALLLAASLKQTNPDQVLTLLEPRCGPLWDDDPTISLEIREALLRLGAHIIPLNNKHFGQSYPHGNKIEAVKLLPEDLPFLFLDTDTLVLDDLSKIPIDFDRPTASLKREGTWPKAVPNGSSRHEIWKSLYDKFDLDFEASLDLSKDDDDWEKYLYFNAGFFFARSSQEFGSLFEHYACEILKNPPKALEGQKMYPWLDQIALPLVIHKLGGGRNGLPSGLIDGKITCHYRTLPLLYAREDLRVVARLEELANAPELEPLLSEYEPFKRLIFDGEGAKLRQKLQGRKFANERELRKEIKGLGLWMR